MADGYEYDVFISYSRKAPIFDWVHNHFYPRLEERLGCEMKAEPRIFVDTTQETGVRWPLNIQKALKKSRILVSVWSPHFFRSEWCVAEWESMLKREEVLKMGSEENPRGLVYAVKFSDGDHFPSTAKDTNYKDLSKWGFPQEGFQETADYLDFQREIEQIAKELEKQVRKAPAWQNDWPVIKKPRIASEPEVELPRI